MTGWTREEFHLFYDTVLKYGNVWELYPKRIPKHTGSECKSLYTALGDLWFSKTGCVEEGFARLSMGILTRRKKGPLRRPTSIISTGQLHASLCEWFYPVIDKTFFMYNEFEACLQYLQLQQMQRLTRKEWSIVRAAMGKPRRLSRAFLNTERVKLQRYRSVVRKYYCTKTVPDAHEFPYGIPEMLGPGTAVSVIHPKKQELCTGCILNLKKATLKQTVYTVLFDDVSLGTLDCPDNIIMPLDASCILSHTKLSEYGQKRKMESSEGGYSSTSPVWGNHEMTKKRKTLSEVDESGNNVVVMDSESYHSHYFLASIQRLLLRKRRVLENITAFNVLAKKQGPPYEEDFQFQYAWLLVNLDMTNRALDPAMAQFRRKYYGVQNEERVQEEIPSVDHIQYASSLLEQSTSVCTAAMTSILKGGPSISSGVEASTLKLITSALLVPTLTKCFIEKNGVTSAVVERVLDKVSHLLHPRFPNKGTHTAVYADICESVSILKSLLTMA